MPWYYPSNKRELRVPSGFLKSASTCRWLSSDFSWLYNVTWLANSYNCQDNTNSLSDFRFVVVQVIPNSIRVLRNRHQTSNVRNGLLVRSGHNTWLYHCTTMKPETCFGIDKSSQPLASRLSEVQNRHKLNHIPSATHNSAITSSGRRS